MFRFCFRFAFFSLSPLGLSPKYISVCWRSNFLSENYDMLPCVIPFRKYFNSFFFSRSNLHLSTSVLIILFLHLLCHVCFSMPLLMVVFCFCCCSADVYCEFLIDIFLPYTHFILLQRLFIYSHTYTHTDSNHYTVPVR